MMTQILIVAARSSPSWSSLSDSWNSLTVLQWAAVISAAILTIGAVIEYWSKIKLLTLLGLKWILGKSTPFDRCVFRKVIIHSLGPILVVVGIAGEVVFEGRAFILEDRQEEEARQSVDSLRNKAEIVSNEEDALKKRLDTASAQMSGLEKEIAAQGPRAPLIAKAAPELAKQLAPFAGQRVELFVCGQQGLADQETLDTWGAIANVLDSDTVAGVTGAKWKEVPTNLNWAGNCGASKGLGQGAGVMVSKRASKNVLQAATVLAHGLANVLPSLPLNTPGLIDPAFAKMKVDRGFMSKDAPWTITAFDPDLIVVVIGEHP